MKHLVVFAGPNGSGKSTAAENFIRQHRLTSYVFVNPDVFASKLFNDIEDIVDRYKTAFDFTSKYLDSLIKNGSDVIIETVNSTNKYFNIYSKCKERGYEITVVFIGTNDPAINIARVEHRVSEGGHDVPNDKIIDRYYRSMDNLFNLACYSDVLYIFDNSKLGSIELCLYRDKKDGLKLVNVEPWVDKYFIEYLKRF